MDFARIGLIVRGRKGDKDRYGAVSPDLAGGNADLVAAAARAVFGGSGKEHAR